MILGRWRIGLFCALGVVCLCVFGAEGGGKKKKSLLVLPVRYMEGAMGKPEASIPFTNYLSEHIKKSKDHQLISPVLGFEALVGVVKDFSSLTRLLGENKKPEQILFVEITNLDGSYTLKAVLYHYQQGQWKILIESPLLERNGRANQVGGWLGELWTSLFPAPKPPKLIAPSWGPRNAPIKGSAEGNYVVDKAATKAAAEANIAKMDPEKQGFAKSALALLDMMNISLPLEAGGKATMSAEMPNPFKKGEIFKSAGMGTWKMDGGKVTITTTHEDIKTKVKKETTMICDLSGNKLTCSHQGRKRKKTLVLIKG